MKLTPRQLAKLRALGRAANEFEMRHAARRDALSTQRDYIRQLKDRLRELPGLRDAALADRRSPEVDAEAILKRHDDETRRLQADLATADGEFEQLNEQLHAITVVIAPLNELLDRVLAHARLNRASAGLNFGADERGPPGERIQFDAPPAGQPPGKATATPSTAARAKQQPTARSQWRS